jgi:nicotinate-nucleotide adenylyltransferase
MKQIGIFGGSFNPIHTGHIALAHQLRQLAGLDEVWLMVSPQNPLKQGDSTLLDDRLRLLLARLALHGESGLRASDYEFRLPRPSYTWTTLSRLSDDYPECRFTLLIGADNWQLFPRWYRSADILERYPIVVYPREGSPVDAAMLPAGVTLAAEARLLPVSSTDIRRRVAQQQSVAGLAPRTILPLIPYLYIDRTCLSAP